MALLFLIALVLGYDFLAALASALAYAFCSLAICLASALALRMASLSRMTYLRSMALSTCFIVKKPSTGASASTLT